jgi:5-(carboxyamino)imidazole ribonucleotide synthase
MINLVGELPDRDSLLREPGIHWHDYGKSARPGRKLGHLTLVENSAQIRNSRASKVLKAVDRATWLAVR